MKKTQLKNRVAELYLSGMIGLLFFFYIQLTFATNQIATELKILPYFEAEGEIESGVRVELLAWPSADKVLFGTYINSHLDDDPKYCSEKNPRPDCTKPTFDKTKIFHLYNLITRKTEFNIKNQFYSAQLDAFQNHQSYTYRRCPADKNSKPKVGYSFRYARLKPADGCIREEWSKINKPSSFSYISADGKVLPLDDYVDKSNLPFWAWIDWLNVYVLGPLDSKGYTDDSPTTVNLLSLDGKLNSIVLGQHQLSSIRPTRAGVIAITYPTSNFPVPNENTGLTLWHKQNRYKVADGEHIQNVEVSPNGCHVAYLVPRQVKEVRNSHLQDITYSKLRVINVCEGFGVTEDTNPFALSKN